MNSMFIEKMNRLPFIGPSDSTMTEPPLCSTIYFTIVRPSPMPSLFMVAVLYSLPKREKSFGMSSKAMPAPVSAMCTTMLFKSYL